MMKVVDLTHPISADMPVYPGTEPPVIKTGCSIEEAGFLEKKITLYSHTGTHIDAPAHLIEGHKTLDQLAVDHFHGKALIIKCAAVNNQSIDMDVFKPYEKTIAQVDFILMHTGWSQYWGMDQYFSDYPVLSAETANWLSNFRLKGIGLDTISADKADTTDFPVHKTLLRKNIVIVENLTNLAALPADPVESSCFPLRFTDADGSPVRAVAIIA